jgi:hypothetical protein
MLDHLFLNNRYGNYQKLRIGISVFQENDFEISSNLDRLENTTAVVPNKYYVVNSGKGNFPKNDFLVKEN